MEKVFCKDCEFYRNRNDGVDSNIPLEFIIGYRGGALKSESSFSATKMCQHRTCFTEKLLYTPQDVYIKTDRISGQGILNKNNDCKYFMKRKRMVEKLKEIFRAKCQL